MPGGNVVGYNSFLPSTQFAPGLDGTTSGTAGLPPGAKGCIISVETVSIRWRAGGTAPTTGEGHVLTAGSTLTFDSWNSPGKDWRSVMKTIRFCGATGSTAAVKVTFFD